MHTPIEDNLKSCCSLLNNEIKAEALCPFNVQQPEDLSFKKRDILTIRMKTTEGWWWVAELNGQEGVVPSHYLRVLNAYNKILPTSLGDESSKKEKKEKNKKKGNKHEKFDGKQTSAPTVIVSKLNIFEAAHQRNITYLKAAAFSALIPNYTANVQHTPFAQQTTTDHDIYHHH